MHAPRKQSGKRRKKCIKSVAAFKNADICAIAAVR